MGKEGVLKEDHVWDVVFSLFPNSLPAKELEFNKAGSTGRENGEVFKSASNRPLIQPMRYRSGDLWKAVGDVGQTPTAMTHKPIARPKEGSVGL